MKILFVLENTISNLEGGTEVSSYHLASLLRESACKVDEWVPYKSRKSAICYTSIIGQLYILIVLAWKLLRNRVDILHIQGKYLAPPVVLLGKLFRIPTVVTIRDYIVVCPVGLCQFNKPYKHDFSWLVREELPKFINTYHKEDHELKKLLRMFLIMRGWLVSRWLKFWVLRANRVISVSISVQKVLEINGVESSVIHNALDFRLLKEKIIKTTDTQRKKILFVGKPSYGKGIDLFRVIAGLKVFSKYEFEIIGGNNKLDYWQTLQKMKDSLLVMVPSRWQEPFGRVALEAIAVGTPVVAANKGGLREIVEDRVTGLLVKPLASDLVVGVSRVINDNLYFRKNIVENRDKLVTKFRDIPVKKHLELYNKIIDEQRPS